MKTLTTVHWHWESIDDEYRANRWYLTGRLDVDTKLDRSLANAVEVFEYLRHAAADPIFLNWKERCQEDPDLAGLLNLCCGIGEIVLSEGFPKLPFFRLPPENKEEIRCWFGASAARWEDFRDLHAQGINLIEFCDRIEEGEDIHAESEANEKEGVFHFMIPYSAGISAAQREFARLLQANRFRFPKGRALAGARKKGNPLSRLKDLVCARLLALHDFKYKKVNNWVKYYCPCAKDGTKFPVFGKKRKNSGDPLFKATRDAHRALARFEKNLARFLPSQSH
jgi:hypothetical protein